MSHNFSELINSEINARQQLKLLAVPHFLDGKNRTEIADFLKISRRSVNILIKRLKSKATQWQTSSTQLRATFYNKAVCH